MPRSSARAALGRTRTVASTITPSTPSEPSSSWFSSGPLAARGTSSVRITPAGVTTRAQTSRSSMPP